MNRPLDDDGDELSTETLAQRTEALQRSVDALTHRGCEQCGTVLCGHAAVLAVVLGYKSTARCPACIAKELAEPPGSLCERALQWIRRRDCFLHVWELASVQEGFGAVHQPACLFTAGALPEADAVETTAVADAPFAAAVYDAGNLGCGDLVLELRFRMQELAFGAVLQVTAHDPAAPIDLPAWCGLCGHTLLHTSPPHYWIQRKRD